MIFFFPNVEWKLEVQYLFTLLTGAEAKIKRKKNKELYFSNQLIRPTITTLLNKHATPELLPDLPICITITLFFFIILAAF